MISLFVAVPPLPVEITNHTDWWQPYLPPGIGLLGSVVVAGAAFYGVRKSNATNVRSIEAADNRELEKWRRDTLMQLSSEVSEITRDVDRSYNRAAIGSDDDEFKKTHQATVWVSTRKLGTVQDSFRIIGKDSLAIKCSLIREAAYEIADPAEQHRLVVRSDDEPSDDEYQETRERLDAALKGMSDALSAFVVAAELELRPTAAQINSRHWWQFWH